MTLAFFEECKKLTETVEKYETENITKASPNRSGRWNYERMGLRRLLVADIPMQQR